MRTRIADLDMAPLDVWLDGHPARCFKLKSFGDELTITVWHAATACGTATGPAPTFSELLSSALDGCERNLRVAEEADAIREEARRRIAERDARGAAE
jgi:hypothetical protein